MRRLIGREIDTPNPSLPGCLAGGPGSGGAMAVSAGLADFALASDHLTGIRVRNHLLYMFSEFLGCPYVIRKPASTSYIPCRW